MRISDPDVMRMIGLFCSAVQMHSPAHQTITRPGLNENYITRWFIGRKMAVPIHVDAEDVIESFVENIYLHEYGRPDTEDFHTHPWDNASLVVRGWYDEELMDGTVHRREPGDIVLRRADMPHRIIDLEPGTVTLFATLKKGQEWGFMVDGQFVHWKDYPLTAMAEPSDYEGV